MLVNTFRAFVVLSMVLEIFGCIGFTTNVNYINRGISAVRNRYTSIRAPIESPLIAFNFYQRSKNSLRFMKSERSRPDNDERKEALRDIFISISGPYLLSWIGLRSAIIISISNDFWTDNGKISAVKLNICYQRFNLATKFSNQECNGAHWIPMNLVIISLWLQFLWGQIWSLEDFVNWSSAWPRI